MADTVDTYVVTTGELSVLIQKAVWNGVLEHMVQRGEASDEISRSKAEETWGALRVKKWIESGVVVPTGYTKSGFERFSRRQMASLDMAEYLNWRRIVVERVAYAAGEGEGGRLKATQPSIEGPYVHTRPR